MTYVRESFFKGADFRDISEMRVATRRWCLELAGQQIHGATRRRPPEVFEQKKRPALGPRGGKAYTAAYWRTATVHPDRHVTCQGAL